MSQERLIVPVSPHGGVSWDTGVSVVELGQVGRPMKILEKKGMLWFELLCELKTRPNQTKDKS